jgi:hypothetical protein
LETGEDMFIRPTSTETAVIFRGVAALMLAVVFGVTLAENQLNNLTHRHEYVQAINLKRDTTGAYSFYLLGSEYSIRAVYNVARISHDDEKIDIEAAGHKIIIPTAIDWNYFRALCNLWRQQFIGEALQFKKSFEGHLQDFRLKSRYYIEQYRHEFR